MKTNSRLFFANLASTPLVIAATALVNAGVFNANFNDGTAPPGSAVWGHAVIETTGGVGNSGCLKLTKNEGSQQGSLS